VERVASPERSKIRELLVFPAFVLVIFVSGELAMTLAQFTGKDIADAKHLGQATVLSCERHGPVGDGIGYWDECTARVAWDNGRTATITIHKRGFFSAAEVGRTVTIGELGRRKGHYVYARKELPSRPLVTLVCAVLGLIAVALSMLLLYVAWWQLRAGVRRLVTRR
jgi:hypothetical protein